MGVREGRGGPGEEEDEEAKKTNKATPQPHHSCLWPGFRGGLSRNFRPSCLKVLCADELMLRLFKDVRQVDFNTVSDYEKLQSVKHEGLVS